MKISIPALREMAVKRAAFGPNAPSTTLASDVLALVEAVEAAHAVDTGSCRNGISWADSEGVRDDPTDDYTALDALDAALARFDFGEEA